MEWTVPAQVIRVIDGDTVVLNLDQGWRVYRMNEHLRLNGIYAPELRATGGKEAADYARSLLPLGSPVKVISEAKPSFERTVGRIQIDNADGTFDFGELMVAAGYAELAA